MNFITKAISCIIIVAAFFYYNQRMEFNAAVQAEREAKIALSAAAANKNSEAEGKYKDGTYRGTARGYGGDVTTEVTVEGGYIAGVKIVSAEGEDAAYYNMCLGILDEIAQNQSADVDTVSGATYTSKGILGGAKKALAKAVK